MFRLPTSNGDDSLVLYERSAISLLTALLLEDLDDRTDTIRSVLETDPILACWAVNEASVRHDIELVDLHAACRWLEQKLTEIVDPDTFAETQSISKASQAVWQSIAATSINAARHAREIATRQRAAGDQSFWYSLLCCTKRQVESMAKLNGHSPLHGVDWHSPEWLRELDEQLKTCVEKRDPRCAANQAIELTSSTDRRWLSDDASSSLSHAYPEAKRLVPALVKKLYRLSQLETQFAETLHEEKMAAMQQLAYGASHEINNPLANISTRAQSLMHTEYDSDRRRKLLAIKDQAFRAYEMIADLMLFAKPPHLQLESVHLNQLIEQVRDEIETSSSGSHRCQLRSGHETAIVAGDPVQLGVAIKAICINGFEAMGGRGDLVVEMSCSAPGHVDISIEDSGEGLSEQAKRHLFDPFFSGREAGRGMGFGLSKAWRIIEQHRGRISVRSDPSRGSCFTITLPTERSATSAENSDAHI